MIFLDLYFIFVRSYSQCLVKSLITPLVIISSVDPIPFSLSLSLCLYLFFSFLPFTVASELFEVSALKISISTKAQTEWTIQRLSEKTRTLQRRVFVWIIREWSFLSLGGRLGFSWKPEGKVSFQEDVVPQK